MYLPKVLTPAHDLNPGPLSRESEALPLSHGAQVYSVVYTASLPDWFFYLHRAISNNDYKYGIYQIIKLGSLQPVVQWYKIIIK